MVIAFMSECLEHHCRPDHLYNPRIVHIVYHLKAHLESHLESHLNYLEK